MKMTNINKYRLLLFILVISAMFLGCNKSNAQKSPDWIVYNCSNMTQSICNYSIRDFTIDRDNNKWLVFWNRYNLVKYDDISFNLFEMPYSIQYCYAGPFCLIADTNGGIWFIYAGQCDYILKFYNNVFSEYNSQYYSGPIDIDTRNRIWVYSNSGPPYYTSALEIRKTEDYSYIGSNPNKGFFKCIRNGETWMCIDNYIVQIRNDTSYYYDTTMLHVPGTGFLDACSDNNSIVWIANALGILKFENNEFTRYDTSNTELEAPVWSITCDPNNRIWLGTDSGLIKFDTVNCSIFVSLRP